MMGYLKSTSSLAKDENSTIVN